MRRAISWRCGVSVAPASWNQASARRIGRSAASARLRPAIFTASASGFSRAPWQTAQGLSAWNRLISSRTQALSVSCQRRCRLRSTPSNGFFTV